MHEVHDMQDLNDPDIVVLTHTTTTKNEPLNGSCKARHPVTLAQ